MSEQMQLGDFAPPLVESLSQFHTPVTLARRIVEWSGVRLGDRVLEPSAGGGNIVREILAKGAECIAIEVDEAWAGLLHGEVNAAMCDVICADFLAWQCPMSLDGTIDMAVMNPPLTGGVACEHVAHALRFAPRVISVMRGQDLHGVERHKQLWSKCDLIRLACCVRRPVYSGDGGKIETVVVEVQRKRTIKPSQSIEHWVTNWS